MCLLLYLQLALVVAVALAAEISPQKVVYDVTIMSENQSNFSCEQSASNTVRVPTDECLPKSNYSLACREESACYSLLTYQFPNCTGIVAEYAQPCSQCIYNPSLPSVFGLTLSTGQCNQTSVELSFNCSEFRTCQKCQNTTTLHLGVCNNGYLLTSSLSPCVTLYQTEYNGMNCSGGVNGTFVVQQRMCQVWYLQDEWILWLLEWYSEEWWWLEWWFQWLFEEYPPYSFQCVPRTQEADGGIEFPLASDLVMADALQSSARH